MVFSFQFRSGETFVLRKKPPGKLIASAHKINREFKVSFGYECTMTIDGCLISGHYILLKSCVATEIHLTHIPMLFKIGHPFKGLHASTAACQH